MTKRTEYLATVMALALAAAMPLAAAQAAPPKKAAAPAAAPAHHASAPHAAPHFTPRAAAPHIAPHRAAAPHFTPHRAAVHHFTPHVATHTAPHAVPHSASVHHFTPHVTAHVTPHVTSHVTTHAAVTPKVSTPNAALSSQPAQIQNAQRRHGLFHRFTQQHTHSNGLAHPNAAATTGSLAQPNALATPHRGHNGHRHFARVTPQAARAGRFTSSIADPPHHHHYYAARRAWTHHRRAGFVSWYGPVFWPYAYSDIFDYAFWPDGYDDGYWDYAYDDFIDGLFWGEFGPPDEYADIGPDAEPAPDVRYAAVQELCQQPGSGITAWPFAAIESKVGLNADQRHMLDNVRDAAHQAASVFKASCPSDSAFPLTPPGRLLAMTARLSATLQAVQTVEPPLTAFFNSLSDEQKERFNELGPQGLGNNEAARKALPQTAQACTQAKPGLTDLPIQEIADVIKPTDAQQEALDRLNDATNKAVSILQGACPQETPLTPPGRLQAMQTRLQAMIEAANTVKPALDDFYGQLSNEQKARFDRIGQELAQVGG